MDYQQILSHFPAASMALTFAGVRLPLATDEVAGFTDTYHPLDGFVPADVWGFEANQIEHLPLPSLPLLPEFELGCLHWPTGLTRCSVFRTLIDSDGLADIRTALGTYSAGPADLVMTDGTGNSRTFRMYFLSADPVFQIIGKTQLYVLTLVDKRFFLRERTGSVTTTPVSWSGLLSDLASQLGITLSVDSISGDYGVPTGRWVFFEKPLSVIVDAVCNVIGHRLVANLDGTYSTQTYATASAAASTQTDVLSKTAGGLFVAGDLIRSVPETVATVFKDSTTDHTYTVSKTLTSLSLTEYGAATGVTGQEVSLVGETVYTGSNLTAITAYATRAATDYYKWRLVDLDVSFPGVCEWTPTAAEDRVEWRYQPDGRLLTRVVRPPMQVLAKGGPEYGPHSDPPPDPPSGTYLEPLVRVTAATTGGGEYSRRYNVLQVQIVDVSGNRNAIDAATTWSDVIELENSAVPVSLDADPEQGIYPLHTAPDGHKYIIASEAVYFPSGSGATSGSGDDFHGTPSRLIAYIESVRCEEGHTSIYRSPVYQFGNGLVTVGDPQWDRYEDCGGSVDLASILCVEPILTTDPIPVADFGLTDPGADKYLGWDNTAHQWAWYATSSASVPTTITVADSTSSTCWVGLFESATGDLAPKTDGGLTYNAVTGVLTATGFSGPLTGNASTATALASARTLWGQSFDGTGNVTGSLTAVGDITGGASSMTVTAGTGNSRTITFKTTTSGGVATTALTLAADQSATFANTVNATTFVGALTGNATTATALATARAIYGNNFDGTAALTQIIASTYGGTGNGFTKFSGPTTAEKTFTLPNASATVLTDNAAVTIAQGGTGQTTAVAAKDALTVKGADIASAATTDLSTATGEFVFVTGTTTITGLGTVAAGAMRTVKFTGALTLTHNATSLILPGAANITTAATDTATFRSLGSGNWICTDYTRASAAPVSGTNTGDQTNISGNAATATALQTGRAINGVTFDGTAAITVTAAAGTLTGTTLNSTVVTSSLTAVGTIGTGVWQGTKIGLAYGGTNADLSATGPGVLLQATNGANVTVGQALDYILLRDEKAQGTDAGTFTSGAWRTRTLNTESADTGSNCSLASNQFTLSAGTYRIRAHAPAIQVDRHQIRLQNTTAATTLIVGTSENAATVDSTGNRSFLEGRFTVAASQALELQHRCSVTASGYGFGLNCNLTTEVYAVVELWKEVG